MTTSENRMKTELTKTGMKTAANNGESRHRQSSRLMLSGIDGPVLLLLLMLLTGQNIFAQREETTARGVQPGNSYSISDIETINNTSGNVMLSIPVAALPAGRGGMSAGVSLNYNSKLWDVRTPLGLQIPPGYNPDYLNSPMQLFKSEQGGWRYGVGYQFEQKRRPLSSDNTSPCYGQNAPDFSEIDVYRFVMTFPDGSSHDFTPSQLYHNITTETLDNYHAVDINGTHRRLHDFGVVLNEWRGCELQMLEYTGGMTFHTTDGSNLRLFVAHDGDSNPDNNFWTLLTQDGTRVTQNEPLTGGGTAQQRIYDRNNNYVEINRAVSGATRTIEVKDQLGRTLTVSQYTDPTTQVRTDTITNAGYNNQPLVWTVKWKKMQVLREYLISSDTSTFPNGTHIGTANPTFEMVEEIIQPAAAGGLSYKFEYNGKTPGSSGDSEGFGEISRVETPAGAFAEYEYRLDGTSATLPHWTAVAHNPLTLKKLTYDEIYDGQAPVTKVDQWDYNITRTESTITAPDGGINKAFYSDVLIEDGVVYSTVAPDGTVNQKQYPEANLNQPWNPAWAKLNNVETTTICNAAGVLSLTAIKILDYDRNGNLVRIKEYDWVPYSSITYSTTGALIIPSNAVLKRTTENVYYNATTEIVPNPSQIEPNEYRAVGSPRMLNALKSTEIKNGSGTVVARSEFTYDDLATKGNLTATKVWDSTKGVLLTADPNTGSKLATGQNANAITTTAVYNVYGSPTLMTDAKGIQTQITYGSINGYADLYPTQTVAAYGTSIARTSTAAYDFYTGLTTSATDVDNNLTSGTDYDALGRPLKAKTAMGTPLEIWTQMTYDDVNRRVISKADVAIKGDARKVGVQFYDQLGRVRLSKSLEDAATQSATNETDGIKVQVRYKTVSGTSGNGYSYQLSSNPYRAATAAGATTEESMGWTRSKSVNTGKHAETETFSGTSLPAPWGSNLSSTGVVKTDADADRTLVTDQAGKQRISRTNALGQLTDVWEVTAADSSTTSIAFPNQTLSAGYQTSYVYDTLSNLTTVSQGSQTRSFTYSSLSRLKSATNPELGTTPTNGTISYQYDDNGNLTNKLDSRGVATTYGYDALNRATSRNYTAPANLPNYEASPNVTYIYDNLTHAKGKLTKIITGDVNTPSAVTEYQQFDEMGRVKQSQQAVEGIVYGTSPQTYVYNLSGALVEQTYPSGRVVKNVLDSEGDLALVQSKKNSNYGYWNYAKSFTYTAAGAVSSMQLGNGKWESTVFNSRLQPVQIGLGSVQNGTDKLKLNFTYNTTTNNVANADNNGNVLSQTITVPTETRSSTTYAGFTATQNYSYDALNRLKSAEEIIPSQTGWKQTFKYDRYGNRQFDYGANPLATPAMTTTPSYQNTTPKVVNPEILTTNNRFKEDQDNDSVPDYLYDASGNTTKDVNNKKFTYDGENKQTKVETVNSSGTVIGTLGEYFYDGDGKRVKKVSATETTIFIYDVSGKLVAEYANPISTTTAQVSYLTSDHLGSPRINTDQNGVVISRHDYQPFGEEIYSISGNTARTGYSTDEVRKQFTSYERDNETDLDFAQARYYNKNQGRFNSADLLLGSGKSKAPQTWNRFAYVLNNPLRLVDPTGFQPEKRVIYVFVLFTDDEQTDQGSIEKTTRVKGKKNIVTSTNVIISKPPNLQDLQKLAPKGTEVKLLTGSDATLDKFKEALQDENAAGVFFIGHGASDNPDEHPPVVSGINLDDGTYDEDEKVDVKAGFVGIFGCNTASVSNLFKGSPNIIALDSGKDHETTTPALTKAGFAAARAFVGGKSPDEVTAQANSALANRATIFEGKTIRFKNDSSDEGDSVVKVK